MIFLGKILYQKSNVGTLLVTQPYSSFAEGRVVEGTLPLFRREKVVENTFLHGDRHDSTKIKVRRMNFSPEYLTYYISELNDNGERIDIAPHYKYLTEKEIQVCKGRLAIHLAKLQVKADKITQSLQDPKSTSGYPRICLENKIITLRDEIKHLEDKYDQILLPNFPI